MNCFLLIKYLKGNLHLWQLWIHPEPFLAEEGESPLVKVRRITPDDYTENKLRYDQEIIRVKQQIERLEGADKSFYVTASYLLQLFKHGEKIFEVASHDEKRELLKLVLSNLQMEGKTVRFTPNEPFATVLKLSERSTWQGH